MNSIRDIRICFTGILVCGVCVWRALWVRRASSHSYICTFVYRPTADEKGDDSDAVLKALEAVIDSKQCLHCANLCMPV